MFYAVMHLAIREQIPWSEEQRVFCERIQGFDYGTPWHFHPEYEFALVRKSGGYRVVGDNVANLEAGDLVFIGSGLPHVFYHDPDTGAVDSTIVQFHGDFAGAAISEHSDFKPIQRLFKRAGRGFQIGGAMREETARQLEILEELRPLRRIAKLLEILDCLSTAKGLVPLCAPGYVAPIDSRDQDRVGRVMQFIHASIRKPISRREVAEVAALSEGAFSRFFHKCTGRTLPTFLNEIRLGRAARLLLETDLRVSDVAFECGYRNLSNFNRHFLEWKQMTPVAFRRKVSGAQRAGGAGD
jgi:AraC-like DNA-binding protein